MTESSIPDKNVRIGFVGLGNLGSAMAGQLVKWAKAQQLPTITVYNRTASKAEPFREMGCNIAPDLASIASQCDLIITSLANDAAARATYKDLFAGASSQPPQAGKRRIIFVETSTLAWEVAGEIENQAHAHGHRYLVCPVWGPPPLARQSKLILVMSGDTHARTFVKPYLIPSIARIAIVVGENVEAGAKLKLLGNSLVLGTIELLSESMTLAEKAGVGADLLYNFVEEYFPTPAWLGYGKKIVSDTFTDEVGFTVDNGLKDAKLMRRLSEENSCPLPTIDAAHQHLLMARSNGGGDMDWSSCVAGQRITAGCHPFRRQRALHKYYEGVRTRTPSPNRLAPFKS